jgi:hypothetical protein
MAKKSRTQRTPEAAPRKVTDLPPRKVQDVKGGALPRVDGESTDERHKGEIELYSR